MLGRRDEALACSREAVARAERILALNPLDGRALAVASLALLEIGDPERANEWSRRAVDLYPDDLSALINRAWAPGQALGAALGGAVAQATSDAVPWLTLSVFCVGTLAVLVRRPVARPVPRSS